MNTKILITTAVAVVASGAVSINSTAHAGPPEFPDLGGYTSVDVHDYEIEIATPGMSHGQVYFLTPDGITCAFGSPPGAGCTGNNFPGVAPQRQDPARGVIRVNSISTDFGLRPTNAPISSDNKVHDHPIKVLPPFHSITVNGVTCGVDDKKMTACKDPQGRGFLLSPAWSGWLEHL